MLIRISLIIAIVAALAVGVLNFVMVKEKIETVEQHRASEESQKREAQSQLANTKKELEKTTADLKQTQDTLAATTAERDKAVKDAEAQTKRATELAEKLSKTSTERDEARSELASYKATRRTPEAILKLDKEIKGLQETVEIAKAEMKILDQNNRKLQNRLAKYEDENYAGPALPASLKGSILVVDPKWDFVVLDFGEEQGALADGELLVNRNGKLVAKVRIHSVQKNRCVANVVTGWKLGEVMERDQVIPAHPAS